jgi:hypothetical protein
LIEGLRNQALRWIRQVKLKERKKRMETWKVHQKYHNYEVSDKGNVRHIRLKTNRNKQNIPSGYEFIVIRYNRKYTNVYIHTMVLETFIGPRPENGECNHKDGIKSHNWKENLEWTTRAKNIKHSYNLGLHKCPNLHGERNPNAKITLEQVQEIRELLSKGITQMEIVKRFGISQTQVSRIKRKGSWKRVLPR